MNFVNILKGKISNFSLYFLLTWLYLRWGYIHILESCTVITVYAFVLLLGGGIGVLPVLIVPLLEVLLSES